MLRELQLQLNSGDSDNDVLSQLSYNEFAAQYLKIQDKSGNIVPFIRNRVQHHFYNARQQSDKRFHLIIKSRQKGISTDIQGEQFYRAITSSMLGVSMANDSDSTQHLRNISATFFDELPENFNVRKTADNASITRYFPTRSSVRIGTAGSKQKGRGGTYTFFHGSEVAFWPNPEKTIAGALQGLAPDGECIFETTANGAQGWVWDTVNNPGKWHIHFYAWWWADEYQMPLEPGETIEYTEDELMCIAVAKKDGFELTPEQIKWRRDKQKELKGLFNQEYPETLETAFLTSGGGVFNANLITFIDTAPAYDPEHIYVAGIDWGQDRDYTVLSISDRTANCQVYLGRWRRMPWAAMREEIVKALVSFNVIMIRPERNSMGTGQIEALWNEIESAGLECELLPFTTGNKNKHELITFYRAGLEDYGYALLDNESQRMEIMTYETSRTTTGMYSYSAPDGGHDDTVIAGALSYVAMSSI